MTRRPKQPSPAQSAEPRGSASDADRRRLWPRKNTPEQIAERQEAVRALPHWSADHDFVFAWPHPPETYAGAQEALTAHMVLPVAVVGPLRLSLGRYAVHAANGRIVEESRAAEDLLIPLAHTEGGLSASMLRGITATLADGGVRTFVLADRMTRDSAFLFRTTEEAVIFSRWVADHTPAMSAWLRDSTNPLAGERIGGVARLSRYAILWEVDTHVIGPTCHLLYRYTTGDACGPNMITRNSHALNHEFIMKRFPPETGIHPVRLFLEANMGGDKKPSAQYYIGGGHGKTVLAEATLSEETLRRVLRTTADDLAALEHAGLHGSHASDMQSMAFTPASAIAAIFAATGQDLGMVGTSSMAHEILERTPEGVHLAIRFSGIEVGTIGGGTGLPHAQAYLSLLRCTGPGSVYRLAQIVAAAALCLELSASAAMASAGSENFAMAHLRQSGRG
ncbi:MAG TPA: 3-hydroxy-3-methylglutaryl-CoA reductase [bacterium]|nr:3-hydroxy-3-methylglutaryl-CoA reductase [bacterium]